VVNAIANAGKSHRGTPKLEPQQLSFVRVFGVKSKNKTKQKKIEVHTQIDLSRHHRLLPVVR